MKVLALSLLLGSAALAQVPSTGGGGVNLSAVAVNIKPVSNGTLNLGSSTKRWSAGFMLSVNSGASTLTLTSGVADGEAAIGFVLNTSNAMASATSLLLSLRNNGSDRILVDKDGNLLPGAHSSMSLGSGARNWAIVYTQGLLTGTGVRDDSGSNRVTWTYNTLTTYQSNAANAANAFGHKFIQQNALTTDGAKVATFYADSGTTKAVDISAEGGIRANAGNIAKPTCGADFRGQLWFTEGGAGVADTWEICRKDAADAYAWTAH